MSEKNEKRFRKNNDRSPSIKCSSRKCIHTCTGYSIIMRETTVVGSGMGVGVLGVKAVA